MIKRLLVVITIIIVVFTGCSSTETTSQSVQYKIPEDIIEKTSTYIIARTGSEFYSKNFRFDNDNSAIDSPYYQVSYRFTMADQPFIDELVTIITDYQGKIRDDRRITGIPECTKDTMLCTFTIDEAGAKEIAGNNGLSKGIADWQSDFTWNEKYNRYVWQIRSVKSEGKLDGYGYRGNGEQIVIDPGTGVVLDKSEWFVR